MSTGTEAFDAAYKTLNKEQKQAVDAVEGPVVVIAGPGTGKTHILTLRVANILQQTQARPSQILVLTFTDSAARTLRNRLASLIGETSAREVLVTTFHGFCEYILSSYEEYFSELGTRRLMGDVEQVLLLRSVIDSADIELLRPPKAPYTYLSDIKQLYETFTREDITPQAYRLWGVAQQTEIENDPALQYVRGKEKGTLTKEGQRKLARFDKVDEAALLLEQYQALKEERGVYDFGDILRVAVDGIAQNDALRATLQETYQYILADEHQDANALQHRLLTLLAYDEHPNLFVVGDEKQSIYRFQGADIDGLQSFGTLFPRAVTVVLGQSFRSLQHVLDTAHSVIASTGEHQPLKTVRSGGAPAVFLYTAKDPLDEREGVASAIAQKIAEGVPAHEIAIITRKNETAQLYMQHLEAHGIPALRAGDVSLTSRPIVQYVLALMECTADPSNMHAYRLLLLAPWWDIPSADVYMLLRRTKDSELSEAVTTAYPKVGAFLFEMQEKARMLTPIECFSYALVHSGAREYILSHGEHLDDVPLIRQLIMYIEELVASGHAPAFTAAMQHIKTAHEHGLHIVKQSVTQRVGMVSVITAHKAKGMEFEHVFIPDATEQSWERGGRAAIIPSPVASAHSLADAQRLFYVALTRAKDCAYISYAAENKDGRQRALSKLVPSDISSVTFPASELPIVHNTIPVSEYVRTITRTYLTADGLSPTAVNEYIESPATFFAHRVLRMHEPPTGPAVFGSAVHRGIAALLKGGTQAEAETAVEQTFARSLLPRDAIFDDLRENARRTLEAYVTDGIDLGEPLLVETSMQKTQVIDGEQIILKGTPDLVCMRDSAAILIDFKTGSSVSITDTKHLRQLALYAEILASHGHAIEQVALVQVTPDGVKEYSTPLTKEMRTEVLTELGAVVDELLRGAWRKGAPSEYDGLLNLFDK